MGLSFYRLIWALPIAFAMHVIEEFATGYPAWATEVTGHIMDMPTFLAGNIAFIAIMLLLTGWTARSLKPVAVFCLLAWAAGNQFWNLVYHVASAWGHDRYSPGLVTATFVYLPLSLVIWRATLSERILRPAPLLAAIAVGGVFMAAVAAFSIYHVGSA